MTTLMPQAPAGVEIGARFVAKRGRSGPDMTIVNIYRPDRRCLVRLANGEQRQIAWADLRRGYRRED